MSDDTRDWSKVVWKEYPDSTIRTTYPPIKTKGKPTHVPMPEGFLKDGTPIPKDPTPHA